MITLSQIRRLFFITAITVITAFVSTSAFSREFPLQRAKRYVGKKNITDWLMSEKLDGIRGYWNGSELLTRKGKRINAPQWFLVNFPPFELDGELWSDRGEFEFIQSTVLDKNPSGDWQRITYQVFETPNGEGDFPSRLQRVEKWFKAHPNDYIRIIPQTRCKGREHLQIYLKEIESKGGEGVIIKDPDQLYHTGRSSNVLKVKNAQDMEGTVTSVNPGKGKFENMMGSLTIKLENGIVFKVGSGFSNQLRMQPPEIGSIITFKYYGLTKNGKPKFASFMRVRKD
jgi:DNA ligase